MGAYHLNTTIYKKFSCHLFLLFMVVLCQPSITSASDIIGDINDNGVVNLEEAIYALQVSSGASSSVTLSHDAGTPFLAAWGTYAYSGGMLSGNFIFSNYVNHGPDVGDSWEVPVNMVSSTTLEVGHSPTEPEIWTRESGVQGDITGKWRRIDDDGNEQIVVLDSNGIMLQMSRGDSYTQVIDAPEQTMTIDGNFNDWGGAALNIFNRGSDCPAGEGRTITGVSVAQDDDYIYVKMSLDGPYDQTYRYKFGQMIHARAVPPPSDDCGLASAVGGDPGAGAAVFGKGPSETDPTDSRHKLECRVSKCLVREWRPNGGFKVMSGYEGFPPCTSHADTSMVRFDFSMCD